MPANPEYSFVLLAAGNSSRLGRPKALLPYLGRKLILHVVDEMKKTGLPVVVVTGAEHASILEALSNEEVQIVHNTRWSEGMASSISTGLEWLAASNPTLSGVIFVNCDQPYITRMVFDDLIAIQGKTGKAIVASSYAQTLGTPAFFGKAYFSHLLNLQGSQGAKKIILANLADVAESPFPQGNIDIDTEKDYANLMKSDFQN